MKPNSRMAIKNVFVMHLEKCMASGKKIDVCVQEVLPTAEELLVLVLQEEGKSVNQPDSKYNSEQLAKGIQVELEHTNSIEAAKEIAKDHLEEIPDYYTRLAKMESAAGIKD